MLWSCSGQVPPTTAPTDDPLEDTAPPGSTGESSVPLPTGVVSFVGAPSLAVPNANVPLVRRLSVCADTPVGGGASVVAEVTSGEERWEVRADDPAACHELGLFGLKPDREHCVVVTAAAADHEPAVSDPLCFRTDPLPADFPRMTVRRNDLTRRAPGLVWMDIGSNPVAGPWYFVALDERLEVVWIHTRLNGSAFELLPDGHLLLESEGDIVELDLYGTELRRFTNRRSRARGVPIDVEPFHHEVHLHDDGTLSSMSTVSVSVPRYPTSYTDPSAVATSDVRDQVIVRWDAAGTVLETVSLGDLLDLRRIGYDSLNEQQFGGDDWGHSNATVRTPEDDGWIVSLRHQDAIVELSDEGAIRWILGTPEGWGRSFEPFLLRPVGDLQWPYHQHAPEVDADRTIRMMDNHNYGASPFDGTAPLDPTEVRSRAVQFSVDPVARTVSQDWAFSELIDGPVFAYARGDCDRLPNGDVLALFPTIVAERGALLEDLGKAPSAVRLVELAFEPDPTPVLDLELWADLSSGTPAGWYAYRAKLRPAPW